MQHQHKSSKLCDTGIWEIQFTKKRFGFIELESNKDCSVLKSETLQELRILSSVTVNNLGEQKIMILRSK